MIHHGFGRVKDSTFLFKETSYREHLRCYEKQQVFLVPCGNTIMKLAKAGMFCWLRDVDAWQQKLLVTTMHSPCNLRGSFGNCQTFLTRCSWKNFSYPFMGLLMLRHFSKSSLRKGKTILMILIFISYLSLETTVQHVCPPKLVSFWDELAMGLGNCRHKLR